MTGGSDYKPLDGEERKMRYGYEALVRVVRIKLSDRLLEFWAFGGG